MKLTLKRKIIHFRNLCDKIPFLSCRNSEKRYEFHDMAIRNIQWKYAETYNEDLGLTDPDVLVEDTENFDAQQVIALFEQKNKGWVVYVAHEVVFFEKLEKFLNNVIFRSKEKNIHIVQVFWAIYDYADVKKMLKRHVDFENSWWEFDVAYIDENIKNYEFTDVDESF